MGPDLGRLFDYLFTLNCCNMMPFLFGVLVGIAFSWIVRSAWNLADD